MDISHFLFLSCAGLFTIAQAQDCSKPVPGANMDLRGEDILKESFPDGTTVRFACNIGYSRKSGSSSITCTAGQWSPVTLICERKSCGSAGELLNGNVEYPEGNQFGDTARFVCNTGYSLVGRDTCRCEAEGWDCRLPKCEVVTCDPPPAIVGGTFYNDKEVYKYREVVEYTCDSGLTLIGSGSITCSDDGQFKPSPPQCKKVECPDVEIVNGQWAEGSRPPHGYQATIRFTCNNGYKMKGQATIKCGSNDKWSPEPPLCIETAETCDRPSAVDHGSFRPDKTIYQYNEVVTYSCDEGYTLSGSASRSCSQSGMFTPALPTCSKESHVWKIVVGVLGGLLGVGVLGGLGYHFLGKKKQSSLKVHDGQTITKGQKGTEEEVILPERKNDADAERKD